jgi:hypothetical protein
MDNTSIIEEEMLILNREFDPIPDEDETILAYSINAFDIKKFVRRSLQRALSKQRDGVIKDCEVLLDKRIKQLRERFKCSACDGAKTQHTQCCQALSEIIK